MARRVLWIGIGWLLGMAAGAQAEAQEPRPAPTDAPPPPRAEPDPSWDRRLTDLLSVQLTVTAGLAEQVAVHGESDALRAWGAARAVEARADARALAALRWATDASVPAVGLDAAPELEALGGLIADLAASQTGIGENGRDGTERPRRFAEEVATARTLLARAPIAGATALDAFGPMHTRTLLATTAGAMQGSTEALRALCVRVQLHERQAWATLQTAAGRARG